MSTDAIRLIMQQYGVDFGTAILIYQGMSVEDARAEVAIKKRRGAEEVVVADRFLAWLESKVAEGIYTPSEVASIRVEGSSGKVWEHYTKNIVGTQWDVGANLQSQLQARIDTGEITRPQAADLWEEERTMRESRARAAGQRAVDFARAATGQLEAPEDRVRRLKLREERETEEELAKTRGEFVSMSRAGLLGAPRPGVEPFTEFGTAEEFRRGFDLPRTEPAIAWFNRRFPRLIQQFQAKPKKEQVAQTWAELLERRKPEIREEFARLSPFQRGERPSVFAPRVTTVRFQ